MDPTTVVIAAVVLAILAGLYARLESITHRLRGLAGGAVVGGIAYFIATQAQAPHDAAVVVGVVFGLVFLATGRRRSRYIRASVRRRKISEWESRTGRKYNPQRHELDHVVPFSLGGSSSEDNIRVTGKKRNRSKGARSPFWDLLGRR
jgi:hypothetical protein